jgi:hypothetical protein
LTDLLLWLNGRLKSACSFEIELAPNTRALGFGFCFCLELSALPNPRSLTVSNINVALDIGLCFFFCFKLTVNSARGLGFCFGCRPEVTDYNGAGLLGGVERHLWPLFVWSLDPLAL